MCWARRGRVGFWKPAVSGGGIGTANVTVDGGIVRAIRDNANFFSNYGAQQVALGAGGGIIDTNGHDIGIAPVMTGAGSLAKDGPGAR
jgi:hypothetical protein